MAKTETQSDVVPGTVFTPRQVRILKIAVIVMGILLVGGFAFVMSAIVYQASNLSESAPANAPAAPGGTVADLVVPKGMAISQMALGDNRLAVHLTGPRGAEIRIIDLGTGKVVTRIPVKSE
ncbi:MAG: hypothetical protein MPJ78_14750 [Hyphomicrobiaceae bacterium]|nr:hypothetical protein [Hyphomicrobiaceae bacterium]